MKEKYQRFLSNSRPAIIARWFYITFIFLIVLITKFFGTANVNFPFWLMMTLAGVAVFYNSLPLLWQRITKNKYGAIKFITFYNFFLILFF